MEVSKKNLVFFHYYFAYGIVYMFIIVGTFSYVVGSPPTRELENQLPSRCYYFGPGTTIFPGADYRRDYGLSRKQCAESCKSDLCCMAFEWRKELNMCTLKGRSLNGTVSKVDDEVFFGLCLDYEDNDRDRFWDHEITGLSASSAKTHRNECSDYCRNLGTKGSSEVEVETKGDQKSPVVIYSWHNPHPLNMDSKMGKCDCITVLHSIKLSFGSFSGFLI